MKHPWLIASVVLVVLALAGCTTSSTQAASPARQWFLAHQDAINTFVGDMQSATNALSAVEKGNLSPAKVSGLQNACSALKREAVGGKWPNPPAGPVDTAYGSMDTDATIFADDCLTFATTADPSTVASSLGSHRMTSNVLEGHEITSDAPD